MASSSSAVGFLPLTLAALALCVSFAPLPAGATGCSQAAKETTIDQVIESHKGGPGEAKLPKDKDLPEPDPVVRADKGGGISIGIEGGNSITGTFTMDLHPIGPQTCASPTVTIFAECKGKSNKVAVGGGSQPVGTNGSPININSSMGAMKSAWGGGTAVKDIEIVTYFQWGFGEIELQRVGLKETLKIP